MTGPILSLCLTLLAAAVLIWRARRPKVPVRLENCLSMRDALERRVREGKPPC